MKKYIKPELYVIQVQNEGVLLRDSVPLDDDNEGCEFKEGDND